MRTADIAITGATGHIGAWVLEHLPGTDHSLRLVVRDPTRTPEGDWDVAQATYGDRGAAPDTTFTLARDHWATEEHLRASGMAFTVRQLTGTDPQSLVDLLRSR